MKTKKENQKTDPQPAKCHPIALGSIDEMLAQKPKSSSVIYCLKTTV